jgi:phage-related protein
MAEEAPKAEANAEPAKAEGETKAEGANPPAEGENKPKPDDCVKPKECPPAGRNAAQQKIDDFKRGVNKKISGYGSSLNHLFTNPAKCANNYAATVPNLVSGIINSIGESISGTFNKVADSMGNLTNEAVNINLVNPFSYAANQFKKKFQDVFNQMILGDGWEKLLNTEKDPAVLAKIIQERSSLMRAAFDDIEFRGGFTKWINNYLDALTSTLEIAKPKINALKKDMEDTVERLGDNIGKTAGHAITNAIVSAISSLPVIGGIVSAINTVSMTAESVANACQEPIAKIGGITSRISSTIKQETDRLDCNVKKVTKLFDKVGNIGKTQQGGGTIKNRNKKILNTTKRVNYLLKQFACKRKSVNYTRRLRRN